MFKSEVKSSKEWAFFWLCLFYLEWAFFLYGFFLVGKISPMVETEEINEKSLLANKYLLHAIIGR